MMPSLSFPERQTDAAPTPVSTCTPSESIPWMKNIGGLRVLLGQEAVGCLYQRNPGPQPGEGLGQLAADGPRANHCEGAGQMLQVPYVFVGKEPHIAQSRD